MNRILIRSDRYPVCATEIRVSTIKGENGTIVLCIGTGSASLQTYATRDELRAIAEMLLRHANEDEVMEITA